MRWLLGMFEARLFPGVNYYLSWCVPANVHGIQSGESAH